MLVLVPRRPFGVTVSTPDSESVDPSSNLGRTYIFFAFFGRAEVVFRPPAQSGVRIVKLFFLFWMARMTGFRVDLWTVAVGVPRE